MHGDNVASKDVVEARLEIELDVSISIAGDRKCHNMAERGNVCLGECGFDVGLWATEECPTEGKSVFASTFHHNFNDCALCFFTLTFIESINEYRDPLPCALATAF